MKNLTKNSISKALKLVVALVGMGVAVWASTTAAVASPPFVTIDNLTYHGSGCPIGTVTADVSPDNETLTVWFDENIAEIGVGVPRRESRKHCNISVTLNVPRGWSYSLATFEDRGYSFLDRGVSTSYSTQYYFRGSPDSARVSFTMAGPYDDDVRISDRFSSPVWSFCGADRELQLNTQVQLRARDRRSEGFVTSDRQTYGILWRRC